MDFKNGEKARMTINNWVEQKTLKKIRYPGRYDEHEQRNQIGLLWKHLDHKFSCKSSPNIWQLFRLVLKKMTLIIAMSVQCIWFSYTVSSNTKHTTELIVVSGISSRAGPSTRAPSPSSPMLLTSRATGSPSSRRRTRRRTTSTSRETR